MRSGPKRRCDATCRVWGPGVSRREGGMRVLTWLVPPDLPRKVAAHVPPYWPMCTCREQSRYSN